MSGTGVVTGHAVGGSATITATSEGVSGTATVTVTSDPCTTPQPISMGETVTNALANGDCRLRSGALADYWRFSVSSLTAVQIDMGSTEVDAYLYLMKANGDTIIWNDDDGPESDARIGYTLKPGTYIIQARSVGPATTGGYTLSLGISGPCSTYGSISVGQTVRGSLANGDCGLDEVNFADPWRLELSSPATVQIDLGSTLFDAYLILMDANGNTLAQDDDSGPEYDARITRTLAAGTYIIWARSRYRWSLGSYTLSVRSP